MRSLAPITIELSSFSACEDPANRGIRPFTTGQSLRDKSAIRRLDSTRYNMIVSTKTLTESEGWEYAAVDQAPQVYDGSRKVKVTDAGEYLVWQAPALRGFTVTPFAHMEDIEDVVQLSARAADKPWIDLTHEVQKEAVSPLGWHKYVLSGKSTVGYAD
ncbi:MAG: hypothetical protein ACOYEP_10555 [Limnochordia bacterium]|jgi:hypothetical protein